MRQGGREERSREVQVPLSDALAAAVAQRTAADAAERAHIKRLTLQVGLFSTARAACEGRVVCAWCFPQPPGRFIGEPPPLRCRPQGRATALPPAPMASPHMQICMLYFALHVLAWRLHSNSP